MHKRPLSPWTYVGSVFLVLVVAAVCFFPLAPLRVKWVVLYSLTGLLFLIFFVTLVRALVFLIIWLATGRYVFPERFTDHVQK